MSQKNGPSRWAQIGADGAWTLLLSCAFIVLSLGLSWLIMLYWVWRVARQSPSVVDAQGWIVVLGKRLLGASVTVEYAQRLRRAAALSKLQPNAKVMVLGGQTSEGPFSEAEQGRNFLLQRGVPADLIHVEGRSLHTLENLRNARELLSDALDKPLTIITSRSHLARSQALAGGLGLPHQLCAAEEQLLWCPRLCARLILEAFYLHWYWVGRLWSNCTGSRKSLARIS